MDTSTRTSMSHSSKLVREHDRSLTLVIAPRRKDILAMRGYLAGNIAVFSGVAIVGPYLGKWDLYLRLGVAAFGILAGYLHGYVALHNPRVHVRFTFRPDGVVLVSTIGRKALRRHTVADAGLELQRTGKNGPGLFSWRWALANVTIGLSQADFEALRAYGVRVVEGNTAMSETTFTKHERREWWLWAAGWSIPWWALVFRWLLSNT